MSPFLGAILIGFFSGLRSMTPIAVVSWAARSGLLHLDGTWMAFLGFAATPWIISLLAIGELIADKLPGTPSRKAPLGFSGRIITGGLSGAAFGLMAQASTIGFILGAIGAMGGTLAGFEFRRRLVQASGGRDLPIALLEDAIAIGGSILLVSHL